MQQGLASLVFGLLGGAIGAVLVTYVFGPAADGGDPGSGADGGGDTALVKRLDAIEDLLESRGLYAARLEGRTPDAGGPGGAAAADGDEVLKAQMTRLFDEAVKARVEETVAAKWEALKKEEQEGEEEPGRKRLPLADVAREVGLSGAEEDELRQIYADAERKMMELMAGEDGDIEDVKRDIESFRDDESQRPALMQKYLPKFMTNIGGIMAIESEKATKVREAVGPEKAAQLGEYDIVEESPLNLNASMRVESREGR